MGLTFRLYRPGDEDKLVLFDHQARGYNSSAEFWRWKYFENPAGPACISLALDGQRVVGRLGFIPIRVRIGTRNFLAAQQVDSDILEDYRKGGTYFRLAGMVEKEGKQRALAFGFGFSTAATKSISTAALGFSVVSPVARSVKVIDPAYYISARWKIPLTCIPGRQIKRFIKWKEERLAVNGVDTREIIKFDSHFNDLWQKANSGNIMVVKDATYLNWRYLKCPTVPYKIFAAWEKGELKGFIAIQLKIQDGVKYGIIADLLCLPDHPEITESLLILAINHFLQKGAVSIKCWLPPNHSYLPVLVKKGFRARATKVYLIVMPNEDGNISSDDLQNDENWSYMLGDSDLHLLADN